MDKLLSHRNKFVASKVPGSDRWEIRNLTTNQVLGYWDRVEFGTRISGYTPTDLLELHDLFIACNKAALAT